MTFVPPAEAISRLTERNKLTVDEAKARLAAQPKNQFFISKADVVFSTLWSVEATKEQVLRAWEQLQERMVEIERNCD